MDMHLRYIDLMQQIDHASRDISAWAEDHGGVSPGELHWGHIGSAAKVLEDLREICRFAGIE